MLAPSDIDRAARAIAGKVHRTPLVSAASLGRAAGVELHLKLESLQKTGSFKPRGALNRLANLTSEQKARGVVTVSAGNAAQAAAWAAGLEGVPCVVVMPSSAPASKIRASEGYGAEIVLHDDLKTIFDRTARIERERGLTFMHPFDDPFVVAGTATVGREILDDLPEAATIVVPVGGGGLVAGIVSAVKQAAPGTRVIGVEPEGADGMSRALSAGRPVRLETMNTIADGLAAPFVGELNLDIVRRLLDGVVLVSDEEIKEAIRELLSRCKILAEPAGAAAVAALLAGRIPRPASPAVAVVSGANLDLDRLRDYLADPGAGR